MINIAVRLYNAPNRGYNFSLNQIHKPTMQGIKHHIFAGDLPVDRLEIVKGYGCEEGEIRPA